MMRIVLIAVSLVWVLLTFIALNLGEKSVPLVPAVFHALWAGAGPAVTAFVLALIKRGVGQLAGWRNMNFRADWEWMWAVLLVLVVTADVLRA